MTCHAFIPFALPVLVVSVFCSAAQETPGRHPPPPPVDTGPPDFDSCGHWDNSGPVAQDAQLIAGYCDTYNREQQGVRSLPPCAVGTFPGKLQYLKPCGPDTGKGKSLASYARIASTGSAAHPSQAIPGLAVSDSTGDQWGVRNWQSYQTYHRPDGVPPAGWGTKATIVARAVTEAVIRVDRRASCNNTGCGTAAATAKTRITLQGPSPHYQSPQLRRLLEDAEGWGGGVKAEAVHCTTVSGGSISGGITIWPSIGMSGGYSWPETAGDLVAGGRIHPIEFEVQMCIYAGMNPIQWVLQLEGSCFTRSAIDSVTFADARAEVRLHQLEVRHMPGCVECITEWSTNPGPGHTEGE